MDQNTNNTTPNDLVKLANLAANQNFTNSTTSPTLAEKDPLQELIRLVKGNNGEIDQLKVKTIFIITKSKLANSTLKKLVSNLRLQDMTDTQILNFLIELDRQIEEQEIDENFFYSI